MGLELPTLRSRVTMLYQLFRWSPSSAHPLQPQCFSFPLKIGPNFLLLWAVVYVPVLDMVPSTEPCVLLPRWPGIASGLAIRGSAHSWDALVSALKLSWSVSLQCLCFWRVELFPGASWSSKSPARATESRDLGIHLKNPRSTFWELGSCS